MFPAAVAVGGILVKCQTLFLHDSFLHMDKLKGIFSDPAQRADELPSPRARGHALVITQNGPFGLCPTHKGVRLVELR